MRVLFSAANSSGLGDYTYAKAVTHKRHAHPPPSIKTSRTTTRKAWKAAAKNFSSISNLSKQRQHLGRSIGHRGHHAQKDLNPVEGPQYDIEGRLRQQPHHKRSEAPLLPLSWFDELTVQTAQRAQALSATTEDAATRRHLENKRRGNSGGHHARAVPAHRPRKPLHNHNNEDATDKHDHFRHQPHNEVCGNDYHDQLGNFRASAASDSPLLTVRKLFSAANSSGLRDYTYSEAVMRTRHPHQKPKKAAILTPEMNLGALFFEPSASQPTPARQQKHVVDHPSQRQTKRTNISTPEMNLGALFLESQPTTHASQQQKRDMSHPREHLRRSVGHRGHHPQHDINPIEEPDYDIEGPSHHVPKSHQIEAATPEMNLGFLFPDDSECALTQQQDDSNNSHDHLLRSYGHRGHHAQQDLNPVERPHYDIEELQKQIGHKPATDGFYVRSSPSSCIFVCY
jgi:hypothetical protein